VALAIGCTIHELSQVLNVQLNQNFPDFVNSYRVEEAKLRMQGSDAMKYTLTAIAMQCGFSAKSSFLRVFKKATNMTPSDYFKSVKVE
jgi:AraC-like DNA-binding protein